MWKVAACVALMSTLAIARTHRREDKVWFRMIEVHAQAGLPPTMQIECVTEGSLPVRFTLVMRGRSFDDPHAGSGPKTVQFRDADGASAFLHLLGPAARVHVPQPKLTFDTVALEHFSGFDAAGEPTHTGGQAWLADKWTFGGNNSDGEEPVEIYADLSLAQRRGRLALREGSPSEHTAWLRRLARDAK